MLSKLIEQGERLALHLEPRRAIGLLNAMPPQVYDALQRTRFRQTLRLAAIKSPFYREEFRRRGINVSRIRHPSELGDFYTTGEDLRAAGAERFLAAPADHPFQETSPT